ncbi:MAG: hypothetical protein U0175_22320 [Caldilineaceae bacterium]
MLSQIPNQLPAQLWIWVMDADLNQQRHLIQLLAWQRFTFRLILATFA